MNRLLEQDAVRVARSLYGLAAAARALPSERDQNFALSTERGAFVLKIAGAAEKREVLDLQNDALAWLAARAPSLPLPRLVPTMAGAAIGDAEGRFVRLLTYLPGAILADAKPQTPALARATSAASSASSTGRSRASRTRRPPAATCSGTRIARSRSSRGTGTRSAIRRAARSSTRFVAEHARSVVPLTGQLRGEASSTTTPTTTTCSSATRRPSGRPVAGLLDFGDMVETWTVCELAVAIAYAIFGKEDPLAAACHLAAGYDRMRPLTDPELEALWSFAAIRLCTSVCLSAHRRTAEPDNLYLMVSEAPGVGRARAHARGPPAPGPLSPARRVRADALPADARDRGLAARAPRRDRARRRRAARAGRRLRPLCRQPALLDARRDDRHAGHDGEALRGHARRAARRSGSAATTRHACST